MRRNQEELRRGRNLVSAVSLTGYAACSTPWGGGAAMQDPTAGTPAPSFLPTSGGGQRSLRALVGLSLRRPGGRRAVSLVTVVLLVSGVAMFAFPAFTDLFQRYQQRHVKLNTSDPGLRTRSLEHKIKVGQ